MSTELEQRTLAARVGEVLQDERAKRRMTQSTLAERTGFTQQWLSRVERGRTQPTTAALDRLFAAFGLQVRVDVEPIGADCDGEIDKFLALTEDGRAEWVEWYEPRFDQLRELPHVLSGRLAAFLQGAPLRVDRLDLAVAEGDLDGFAGWLERTGAHRWNQRWLDYDGSLYTDPRLPGLPLRWMVGLDEVRMEVLPVLPPSITVSVVGRELRVRPLPDVERDHPDVGRIMRRVRARAGVPGPE